MLAKDVMSDGVVTVHVDATVFEAAKLLINAQVSALPVVDGKGLMVGIVSEADLLESGAAGPTSIHRAGLLKALANDISSASAFVRANSQRVGVVMTKHVISVDEGTPLGDIARLMLDAGVKRVPVRRGEAVVGVVSRIDLVRALISQRSESDSSEAQQSPRVQAPAPTGDDQLRTDIQQALRGRSWALAKRADVVVRDGVAHLWGVVPSDLVRQAYCVAAENVPGVKSVLNHMHVVPPSPTRLGL
jgi:CBS domain-containing protein